VVLGTIGYMSPEQVRGLTADHRSDLFAFGAVLYEMLSGQRAFTGDTPADTMTAILKEDPPDLPVVDRKIPSALTRIVDRCLEKSPGSRFQSAGDLAFALDALSSSSPSGAAEAITTAVGAPKQRDKTAWMLALVFAAVSVVALAVAAFAYFGRPAPDVRTLRYVISLPDGWSLATTGASGVGVVVPAPVAVSPDGRRVALVARSGDRAPTILVRSLDTLAAQSLPGTDGASAPFWSPDSRFLGFFAGGKLKKIDVTGGPPVTLCDAGDNGFGAWGRQGMILIVTSQSPLRKVSAAGGTPTAATTLAPGESGHVRPMFLPDGQHFLYRALVPGGARRTSTGPPQSNASGAVGTASRAAAGGAVFAASLDSAERTEIMTADSTNVAYAQGHLLFLRGNTLMAQPFDAGRLTLTGEALPVAEQIQQQTVGGYASGIFSASDNGVLVYQAGNAAVSPAEVVRSRREPAGHRRRAGRL
jgi:hypothetical protein